MTDTRRDAETLADDVMITTVGDTVLTRAVRGSHRVLLRKAIADAIESYAQQSTARALAALREQIEQMHKGPVPPTIAMDDEFRFIYAQAYRHALSDVLALLPADPSGEPR